MNEAQTAGPRLDAGLDAWRSTAPAAPGRLTGATYYGLPAVKPSPWAWHTGAYLFAGGLGGGAQVIAGLAAAFGGARMRPVVANARYLALAGAVAGAGLLIADLKTPKRWYNMLRIFRPTSPMSIGTYVLSSFGATSALAVVGGATGARVPSAVAQWPAAVSGAAMTVYPGALLAASSNPLWASEADTLAPRYACGALTAAAATLSLAERIAGRHGNAAKLDRVALAGTLAEGALTARASRGHRGRGVGRPLRQHPWGTMHKLGNVLSVAVPLACYALAMLGGRRRSPALSVTASLSLVAGTALKRWNYVNAGNEAARRPEEYLEFARGKPDDGSARAGPPPAARLDTRRTEVTA